MTTLKTVTMLMSWIDSFWENGWVVERGCEVEWGFNGSHLDRVFERGGLAPSSNFTCALHHLGLRKRYYSEGFYKR